MARGSRVAVVFGLLLTTFPWAAAQCDAAPTSIAATTESADEPGLTSETAIILEGATNELDGVQAEHIYTSKRYPGWKWRMQSLMNVGDKHYDIIELVGQNGETKTIYFDISSWFGKME
jgi:hypothetical protein